MPDLANEIDVVIEDPRGTTVRHHWDDASRRWILKRHPFSMHPWPANYGYVVGTYNPVDRDALDILVLSRDPLETGASPRARAVGVLRRPDGDDKILGVLVGDPDFGACVCLSNVPRESVKQIEEWFAQWSEVGECQDVEAATNRIQEAREWALRLKSGIHRC